MRLRDVKASVIIPTYNHAQYLRESVNSVLRQTFQDFELIIVDDASQDETKDLVQVWMKNDPRIRYFRHSVNQGPAVALNTGIQNSRGYFITWMGADDRMLPHNLEKKVFFLENYGNVDVVYSDAEIINSQGETLGVLRPYPASDQPQIVEDLFERLLRKNFIVASTVMVRKKCLDRFGGFDTNLRYAEDWELWFRLARRCVFAYLPEPLIQYRVREFGAQNTAVQENLDIESMHYILQKVYSLYFQDHRNFKLEKILGSNYFRVLNNKLGVVPKTTLLKLYLRGLKAYPRSAASAEGLKLTSKLLLYLITPKSLYSRLERGFKKGRKWR